MAISPDQTQYHTRPFAGLGSVGSYQVAGAPFMTGRHRKNHRRSSLYYSSRSEFISYDEYQMQ